LSRNSLEVIQVGSYNVSVAKNLSEIKLINTDVFKLADNTYDLLKTHYQTGFGFIICAFDPSRNIKPHPIGYVHSVNENSLFVPTRHKHGEKEENIAHWDHLIYSTNTKISNNKSRDPGVTPQQLRDQILRKKNVDCIDPKKDIEDIQWNKLPKLSDINSFRQRKIVGKFDNIDLKFELGDQEQPREPRQSQKQEPQQQVRRSTRTRRAVNYLEENEKMNANQNDNENKRKREKDSEEPQPKKSRVGDKNLGTASSTNNKEMLALLLGNLPEKDDDEGYQHTNEQIEDIDVEDDDDD